MRQRLHNHQEQPNNYCLQHRNNAIDHFDQPTIHLYLLESIQNYSLLNRMKIPNSIILYFPCQLTLIKQIVNQRRVSITQCLKSQACQSITFKMLQFCQFIQGKQSLIMCNEN
ncbi:hypothetical protein FGO68_gene9035 [Halteria grandinella]|uniref:Uncharacterized protein n=1 Tax=Halteria grandinella TaxID=5974 RepID=A0A8J8NF68_HALGN|nr:hypothetical protein FGO68_gene9035 [Halteria grandinella]